MREFMLSQVCEKVGTLRSYAYYISLDVSWEASKLAPEITIIAVQILLKEVSIRTCGTSQDSLFFFDTSKSCVHFE